ncbi:DUF3298 and DUF4163 domain-containing protein [Diplocloster agilis]|uniref:DUF3298 and DUF4163 domain-containing protein n=1 Tax=Diplocloster agilis TaxID=2850323 RepID=A0A949NJ07_9FIRM|nr:MULTISPECIES: DUF3298 and DUF4163 domain-containing protein [Lachnospiraceae]MBU9739245.1 DUF3298 and DUF4163 domain-containing protein [Diplocloster agilis]MCU6733215.1 DUF3298 and DUF4163 domain-containing protein [Suonthocola fibrivorans]SCI81469.1 Anti-sigma-V factor rsiV [uncultured Clostridium sp.]
MRNIENTIPIYEAQTPPQELAERINLEIAKSKKRRKAQSGYAGFKIAGAMAACLAIFIILLNTNQGFAMAASRIPVVGSVARVFTFRSYEEKTADQELKVEIPEVVPQESAASGQVKDYTLKVNQLIQEKVDQFVEESKQRVQEYKEAFIATGGTEEEFKEHDIKSSVTYDVKLQQDNILSFVIMTSENWVSAYNQNFYFNMDLNTGKDITLDEVLGANYVQTANESILRQMKERTEQNPDYTYFTPEEGGFETIGPDTSFYINEKGNPVVVFAKYEVAPGFMGTQEFEIEKP